MNLIIIIPAVFVLLLVLLIIVRFQKKNSGDIEANADAQVGIGASHDFEPNLYSELTDASFMLLANVQSGFTEFVDKIEKFGDEFLSGNSCFLHKLKLLQAGFQDFMQGVISLKCVRAQYLSDSILNKDHVNKLFDVIVSHLLTKEVYKASIVFASFTTYIQQIPNLHDLEDKSQAELDKMLVINLCG